ncbi:metallophosphoesterase family protein [Neobacillus sp. D3-1R]|uniref:metallophosphoesterase family protein n=1 Tax=Neobacillus sp. D3-1R TaxID=3445778 RepID=UPI003F9EF3D3
MKFLRLNNTGSFKIVQFTDLHLQDGSCLDQCTILTMEKILDREKPDFVVLTGDVIRGQKCKDPQLIFPMSILPMEKRNIPWAIIFGNHDDEGNISKIELMKIQESFPNCFSQRGKENLSGVGNFDLGIIDQNGKRIFTLYFFDSGTTAPAYIGGYDWIKRDQIDWYIKQSIHYQQLNNGEPIPSLSFFHIPLPEFNELWDYHTCYGSKQEAVGCPKINSGLFSTMVERQDMIGVFVGHDHVNDFNGELFGIHLCYGRATGFNTYGKEGFSKGARVIEIKEETKTFQTWVHLEDGTIIQHQIKHNPNSSNRDPAVVYVDVQ